MMLGRLDDSIEAYKELGTPTHVSTIFGAAVALDRAERGQLALDLIRGQGATSYRNFRESVNLGRTFFVPEGEKFYYFALVDEALGLDDDAINYWRQYINSGAHPQYQPRARAHLDTLLRKKRVRTLPIELPWRGILR